MANPQRLRGPAALPALIVDCSSNDIRRSPSEPNSRPNAGLLESAGTEPLVSSVYMLNAEGSRANLLGDVQAMGDRPPSTPNRPTRTRCRWRLRTAIALVRIFEHRQDGAEDLSRAIFILIGRISEQRGPDVPAAVTGFVSAAEDDFERPRPHRPRCNPAPGAAAVAHKGSHVGGLVGGVADLQTGTIISASASRDLIVATFADQNGSAPRTPARCSSDSPSSSCLTVWSMSASVGMIAADLPPSSRLTRLSCSRTRRDVPSRSPTSR